MVCSSVTRLQHVIIITHKNAVCILRHLVRYYVYLRDFFLQKVVLDVTFVRSCQWTQSWARWIQITPSRHVLFLWTQQCTSEFNKNREIWLRDRLLASQGTLIRVVVPKTAFMYDVTNRFVSISVSVCPSRLLNQILGKTCSYMFWITPFLFRT